MASVCSHPRVHHSCLSKLLKHILKPLKQGKTKQNKTNATHTGVSTTSGPLELMPSPVTCLALAQREEEKCSSTQAPTSQLSENHWKSTQDTTGYKSHLCLQNSPSWHGGVNQRHRSADFLGGSVGVHKHSLHLLMAWCKTKGCWRADLFSVKAMKAMQGTAFWKPILYTFRMRWRLIRLLWVLVPLIV